MKAWIAALLWVASACAWSAPPVARYAGFLPCANCPALRMELALFGERGAPAGYEQRLVYVDTRDGDKVVASAGRWRVVRGSADDAGARVIELSGEAPAGRQFLLEAGDGSLRLLDGERREIASPQPQVLRRSEREFVGDPVTVTEADAGRPIGLRVGQELVVKLASQPSTGYGWTPRSAAEPVLAPLAAPVYVRGEAAGGMVGVAGTQVWRFAAFRGGAQALAFDYRRPWERAQAPARTVSFPVEVR